MQKISSCLWFNDQAEEAAHFYTSLFKDSKIGKTVHYGSAGSVASGQKPGSVMLVEFELNGHKVMGLNGGPHFKFNPSFSYFVWCDTEEEINKLWRALTEGGEVRMELGKYPWSERYGFTADKFGVNWQLNLKSYHQKIAPAFLFVDKLYGKAEDAINFYTSVFKNSKIEFMARDESSKAVLHCLLSLEGQSFVLMEGQGEHNFGFNNAFSLVVNCDSQDEIDYYWSKLTSGGASEQCGWLKDKFGVSWQIVPSIIGELMQDKDPKKAERAMQAVLQMEKLDIKKIKQAYEGE